MGATGETGLRRGGHWGGGGGGGGGFGECFAVQHASSCLQLRAAWCPRRGRRAQLGGPPKKRFLRSPMRIGDRRNRFFLPASLHPHTHSHPWRLQCVLRLPPCVHQGVVQVGRPLVAPARAAHVATRALRVVRGRGGRGGAGGGATGLRRGRGQGDGAVGRPQRGRGTGRVHRVAGAKFDSVCVFFRCRLRCPSS